MVKTAYFQLAYLCKTLTILESDGELLKQVEQAADACYRSGMGTQQDVLKQLLNPPQDSPDIEPADLPETPLPHTYDELLAGESSKPRARSFANDDRQRVNTSGSRPQGFLS